MTPSLATQVTVNAGPRVLVVGNRRPVGHQRALGSLPYREHPYALQGIRKRRGHRGAWPTPHLQTFEKPLVCGWLSDSHKIDIDDRGENAGRLIVLNPNRYELLLGTGWVLNEYRCPFDTGVC